MEEDEDVMVIENSNEDGSDVEVIVIEDSDEEWDNIFEALEDSDYNSHSSEEVSFHRQSQKKERIGECSSDFIGAIYKKS
ncbi:wd repeat-containing protein 43 [Lasius niger]|uniref:Wd repeat-containing protein 43 n=1 Tax=Lasius niger TaxID=67767 RepID=A0A0J7K1C4_LASNI|nr:wd repeat-containing protein 43 [Lasius niger]